MESNALAQSDSKQMPREKRSEKRVHPGHMPIRKIKEVDGG